MGYVTENLLMGEKVVYQTHLHWIIFWYPIILILLGLYLAIEGLITPTTLMVWLLTGLLAVVFQAIHYNTAEFGVTDRRVRMKIGVLRRRSLEINLAKVESVGVDQSIFGRILGYGLVVVNGTGGTREAFGHIADPIGFRHQVQEQAAHAHGFAA
jgi:uncharacterized membrane protein YdbT with pleckstrin-like domain